MRFTLYRTKFFSLEGNPEVVGEEVAPKVGDMFIPGNGGMKAGRRALKAVGLDIDTSYADWYNGAPVSILELGESR